MIVFLEIQSSWSVFPPGWSTICSMTIICNALTSQDYISIWHPGSTNREILCPVSGEDNIMGICKKQMIYIINILRKLSPFPYTKQHYTHYRIECLLQKEKIIIFFFLKFRLTTTDKRCVTSIMYGKYIKEKKSHIFWTD